MTAINIARAVITVLWFVLFIAISIGAWWLWRRDYPVAVSHLPLEDSAHLPQAPEEHP